MKQNFASILEALNVLKNSSRIKFEPKNNIVVIAFLIATPRAKVCFLSGVSDLQGYR